MQHQPSLNLVPSSRSIGSELEEEELMGNSGRDSRSFRKRTKSEDGQSSSDNEKGSAPKIPTGSRGGVQSRGRGRGLTAQESAQRAEKLAAEGRHPGAVGAGERPPRQAGGAPDAGADSAEEARRSFGELMVAALRDMGRKRLAKPSSKAKTVLKHATSLSEAFDKALDKSVAKLRAELRAELRAGPAGPGAVRREAVGGGPGQGQGQSQPQPQPEAGSQLLTLVQSELAAFRQQLQQQQQQFQLQIQRQLSLLEGIVAHKSSSYKQYHTLSANRSIHTSYHLKNLHHVKYRSAFERFPAECGSLGLLVYSVRSSSHLFLHRTPFATEIMKKSKLNSGTAKKKTIKVEEKESENTENVPVAVDSLDDEEQGFGGWLRSSDGLETMKLFVIANSIVMLTTIVYPHAHAIFEIVSDMIYGTDVMYDDLN
ncbi:hypothetical protein PYW08_002022 [Mythimna loreyi]|uniref:Uncharacterized protein n=1 Tax=Mythimna loreyi TaxID=667449 RepID=A0ACC2R2Z1_9NEOP|nr:hypothetical protein PYW08_002022 [Mythimna loreyi]